MQVKKVVDARKERIKAADAWELLKDADKITIAKGKKFAELAPQQDAKEEILKQALGPSGNLRAPTYRVGAKFVIGYNGNLYEQWLRAK